MASYFGYVLIILFNFVYGFHIADAFTSGSGDGELKPLLYAQPSSFFLFFGFHWILNFFGVTPVNGVLTDLSFLAAVVCSILILWDTLKGAWAQIWKEANEGADKTEATVAKIREDFHEGQKEMDARVEKVVRVLGRNFGVEGEKKME